MSLARPVGKVAHCPNNERVDWRNILFTTVVPLLRFARVCMRVRLTWVERDFRGSALSSREEILHGESAKSLTRNHVARLITRSHPELLFANGIMLLDASEEGHKWYVRAIQTSSNSWVHVYADPLEDAFSESEIGHGRQGNVNE